MKLREIIGRDHFAASDWYTGIADATKKKEIDAKVDRAAAQLADANDRGASKAELLTLLKSGINAIPLETLDTEDAERVASTFESMLDPLNLESSEGILNTWMYGIEINDLRQSQ